MEEWDDYLTTSTGFFPSSPIAAKPHEAAAQAAPAAGVLDDMFMSASPPPASASPGGSIASDPFASPGSAGQDVRVGGSAPDAAPRKKSATTADSLMQGFMGVNTKKKNQTLGQMQQQQETFLNMNSTGPQQAATCPSLVMQSIMTYYEVLGLAEMCNQDQIKSVYKQKSLQLHPDRNPNAHENDVQMFKLVTKAYETLSDPQLRAQYDMELRMKNQMNTPQPTQQNWLNHLGGGAGRPGAPPAGGMPPMPAGGMGSPFGGAGSPFSGASASGGMGSPPPAKPAARKNNDPFASLF